MVFRSISRRLMLAPATVPPLSSSTVPFNDATLVCDQVGTAEINRIAIARIADSQVRTFIGHHPFTPRFSRANPCFVLIF